MTPVVMLFTETADLLTDLSPYLPAVFTRSEGKYILIRPILFKFKQYFAYQSPPDLCCCVGVRIQQKYLTSNCCFFGLL